MNYARIKPFDVANGPGIRVSLFVSGCRHFCKGCFNPEAWDFSYGEPFTKETVATLLEDLRHPHNEGLSLLGGEPMEREHQRALLPFLIEVKKEFPEKTIWLYTGYDFEKEILGMMYQNWEETRALLPLLDVIVDGRFVEEQKDLTLRFRGSRNQRILLVKESLQLKALKFWEE